MAGIDTQAIKDALRDAGYQPVCCTQKRAGYIASAIDPQSRWHDSDPQTSAALAWQSLGKNLLPALGPRQARQLRLALGGA